MKALKKLSIWATALILLVVIVLGGFILFCVVKEACAEQQVIFEKAVGKPFVFFSFDFPTIKLIQRTTYEERIIPPRGTQIASSPIIKSRDLENVQLEIVWLWIPALIIFLVSILSLVMNIGAKKIIDFYLVTFTSVPLGVMVGNVAEVNIGMVIAFFLGGFTGIAVGTTFGPRTELRGLAARASFAVVCGLVAMFSAGFTSAQGPKLALQYGVFLLIVEVLSFIVAWLINFAMQLLETAKVLKAFTFNQ